MWSFQCLYACTVVARHKTKDPEDFLLFNSVRYSLQHEYEAQRHVKAFDC